MSGCESSDNPPPQVDVAHQIIVGFKPEAARIGFDSVVARLGGLPATVLNSFVTASPRHDAFFAVAIIRYEGEKSFADLKKHLESQEHVAWVERNAPVSLAYYNDPLLAQQWALATLQARDRWTVVPPAGKTTVAIVDSGLRRPDGSVHADLGAVEPAAVCQPPSFFPDNVDMDGHGTLLAGTIAAVPGNGVGIGSPIPATWNISLLPVKFFSPQVPPNAGNAAIALAYAATALFNPVTNINPVRVINASWHVAPGDQGLAALRAATTFATALRCLVVFAAGNDGTDNELFPAYPANFGNENAFKGNVLTVLASDHYDGKAFFSNYGRNTVDIAAPGLRILSTGRYLVDPPRYAEYSGTSPAAAYASAGAALVFALNPGWAPLDVAQHLKASADPIADLKLACIDGKRLNLGRTVYGPLQITAPLAGAQLNIGAETDITWTNEYVNPSFKKVKIEFSTDDGATYGVLATSVKNSGLRKWKPVPGFVTSTGRIRITPIHGNFPVVSGRFSVV